MLHYLMLVYLIFHYLIIVTSAIKKTRTQDNNGNSRQRKVVVTGDTMLNGFNECGLSKHQNVKIQNFPDGTTETIIEKVETLAKTRFHNYT